MAQESAQTLAADSEPTLAEWLCVGMNLAPLPAGLFLGAGKEGYLALAAVGAVATLSCWAIVKFILHNGEYNE